MSRPAVVFLLVAAPALAVLLAVLGYLTLPTNILGWFLLFVGFIYFFGTFISLAIRKGRFYEPPTAGQPRRDEHRDRSFWYIVVGMTAAFYLPPAYYLLLPAVIASSLVLQIAGLFLVAGGAALFAWARRTLGIYFSGHLVVTADQPLVQRGPYRVIRHPGYAAYILMALGISIGYASFVGLGVILFVLLPGVVYRVRVEERLLEAHFGDDYRRYQARTSRMIPGVW
ncbi:MAG: methyltransferase family protein [Anaerolineae bacterium]